MDGETSAYDYGHEDVVNEADYDGAPDAEAYGRADFIYDEEIEHGRNDSQSRADAGKQRHDCREHGPRRKYRNQE